MIMVASASDKPRKPKLPCSVEIYQSEKNKQWYWRLKAKNGNVVATGGEGYEKKAGVRAAVRKLMVWAMPTSPEIPLSPLNVACQLAIDEFH